MSLLTALEACAYLEMTWAQWKVALWRGVKGADRETDSLRIPQDIKERVFARDRGVCHRCGTDTEALMQKLQESRKERPDVYRALLARLQISDRRRSFWVPEREPGSRKEDEIRTTCLVCFRKHKRARPERVRSDWVPTPVRGTWASKTAVYTQEDIERFRAIREGSPRVVRHRFTQIDSTPEAVAS
jgi:hypothetical protein